MSNDALKGLGGVEKIVALATVVGGSSLALKASVPDTLPALPFLAAPVAAFAWLLGSRFAQKKSANGILALFLALAIAFGVATALSSEDYLVSKETKDTTKFVAVGDEMTPKGQVLWANMDEPKTKLKLLLAVDVAEEAWTLASIRKGKALVSISYLFLVFCCLIAVLQCAYMVDEDRNKSEQKQGLTVA